MNLEYHKACCAMRDHCAESSWEFLSVCIQSQTPHTHEGNQTPPRSVCSKCPSALEQAGPLLLAPGSHSQCPSSQRTCALIQFCTRWCKQPEGPHWKLGARRAPPEDLCPEVQRLAGQQTCPVAVNALTDQQSMSDPWLPARTSAEGHSAAPQRHQWNSLRPTTGCLSETALVVMQYA